MDSHVYSYDEAYQASISYFKGDELAARVWVNKYALRDSSGNIYELNPDDMHWRISREVSRIEQNYPNPMSEEELFQLFQKFQYLVPQGSPMMNIGNPYQLSSLSNCFVIGIETTGDSYGAVMKLDEEQVQLMKRRGGVGQDLSGLRPKGMKVNNSALTSAGIVPFMERYSNSTKEVVQEGRKGALMLSLSIKHPDAEAFIDAKAVEGKMTGANVSVRVDDEFMQSVVDNTMYTQQYPVDSENPLIKKDISAVNLWRKIVHNAWKMAEPGILFWDTIIRESIPDCYEKEGFKTISTNPCGEIPLCPYDSCRLLSINLYSYVKNPFEREATFDFDLLRQHVRKAQRVLDDIVDLELEMIDKILKKIDSDPESEEVKRTERELWLKIKDKTTKGRRTGLGTTAEGDMLAAMGLTYGTPEANYFSEQVHQAVAVEAYRSSVELAEERGAFPLYDADLEKKNPFIGRIKMADAALYQRMTASGRRNIACLTIAPTGTTSLMTQTTSGIEPVFMPVYKRRRKVNANDETARVDYVDEMGDSYEEYVVFHRKFMTWMEVKGYDTTKAYKQSELDKMVMESPYYKATTQDVNWLGKVQMQGRVQKWVDHSISVTINLPESATEELVGQLYEEAWKCGCKGVTVYREGSRSGVLLSSKEESKQSKMLSAFVSTPRPKELNADVVRFQNNKEKWIAFIGLMDGRPYEIFTGLADDEDGLLIPKTVESGKIIRNIDEETGRSRYDFQYSNRRGYKTTIEGLSYKFNPEYWNYAKLISGVLRYGMPIDQVIKLVGGLQLNSETINNWKNGVERALKKYIPNGTEANGMICEKCGEKTIRYQEGCLICTNCGFSKCGS
ncbi:MAG: adenosylcobalamin-dependent ribonucleoside-diphosphate reductase [Paludibacteraceae bacterium]|nr:adenosylcobalamin-dependent ribonucleoside-diphosphate reductase [Paludibacteraceae bacterium]